MALDETARINVGADSMFKCPKGHLVPLMEGAFDARDGVLRIRDAQGQSALVWQKIQELTSQALSGQIAQDDAIEAIALLAPDLGTMLRLAKGRTGLAILAFVLWFIAQVNGKTSSEMRPIFIENQQISIGQVSVNEGSSLPPPVVSTSKSIPYDDHQHSKRKRPRIAGKNKERHNRSNESGDSRQR
jgi:hypothetical protein